MPSPTSPIPRCRTAALVLAVLVLAACEERPKEQVIDSPTDGPAPVETQRLAFDHLVAELAYGKDPSDAKASKRYDDARDQLISRGSAIENDLIDTLRRNDDWSIRYGLVEVLQATGTRASVPHLIAVLDDPEPLVAYMANQALQEMTGHAEIPKAGTGSNGLPAVPKREASDLGMDAEQRQWAAWHHQHGTALRSAWDKWWAVNKDEVGIR